MKRTLILIGLTIVLIIGIWFFFVVLGNAPEQTPRYSDFPGAQGGQSTGSGGQGQQPGSPINEPNGAGTMPLETDSGAVVYVNDIVSLPNTKQMSSDSYELGPFSLNNYDPEYNIVFYEQNESFAISLRREPLQQNRIEVETYLQKQLGISRTEMCQLKVYLGTSVDFNPFYGGKDLGFSFCPGSVQLE